MGPAYPLTLFMMWIKKPEDAGRQETANAHLNESPTQRGRAALGSKRH
jgi:hypothetical protein